MNHTSDSVHITAHTTVTIESVLPSSPSSFLNVPPSPPPDFARGYKFWCIVIGISVTNLLGALENTVVSTAAPVILSYLQMGQNFIWITNAFFVCSSAFQPLFGQLCNIFGRSWIAILIVAIFILGSGICGGARNGTMLVAGRAVQGMGSEKIRAGYREALKRVWQIARVFAGLACVLVLLEKEIPLTTSLETEYGLKESLRKPQERKDIERN
ncbi:uncharacterized protein EAF02_000753 [Botrytis sinoallii]|uniref:uncharacterized protein n=1 Tax=Botrytis sinoallii TaxID=1463999 RepID=UPI001900C5EC|nr:uncharacterized protein EAF02_000753 [Botrytis sinoallii]KAF7893215.1 hypothetical protein EAF02_000753 [Botrytis sinoallii]